MKLPIVHRGDIRPEARHMIPAIYPPMTRIAITLLATPLVDQLALNADTRSGAWLTASTQQSVSNKKLHCWPHIVDRLLHSRVGVSPRYLYASTYFGGHGRGNDMLLLERKIRART